MNGDGDHMSPKLGNEHELNNLDKEVNSSVKEANSSAASTSDDSSSSSDDSSSSSSSDDEPQKQAREIKMQSPWSQLFKNNRDLSAGLELDQYEHEDVVQLSEQDVHDTKAVWKATLMGYVVGKPAGPNDIEALRQQWKISFQYLRHPSGWTIFQFDTDEQKKAVLANGPYNSSGFPWILKDIPPFFSFGDESFNLIPVWVTLPGLPLECWNQRALSKITSQVGKPITTDKCTKFNLRVSFARVLVEINATKSLIRSVKIKMPNGDVLEQPVLYEYEPKLCNICSKVGHSAENCRSVKKPRGKSMPGAGTNSRMPRTMHAAAEIDMVKARPCLFKSAVSMMPNPNEKAKLVAPVKKPVEGNKSEGSTTLKKPAEGNKSEGPTTLKKPGEDNKSEGPTTLNKSYGEANASKANSESELGTHRSRQEGPTSSLQFGAAKIIAQNRFQAISEAKSLPVVDSNQENCALEDNSGPGNFGPSLKEAYSKDGVKSVGANAKLKGAMDNQCKVPSTSHKGKKKGNKC